MLGDLGAQIIEIDVAVSRQPPPLPHSASAADAALVPCALEGSGNIAVRLARLS